MNNSRISNTSDNNKDKQNKRGGNKSLLASILQGTQNTMNLMFRYKWYCLAGMGSIATTFYFR